MKQVHFYLEKSSFLYGLGQEKMKLTVFLDPVEPKVSFSAEPEKWNESFKDIFKKYLNDDLIFNRLKESEEIAKAREILCAALPKEGFRVKEIKNIVI